MTTAGTFLAIWPVHAAEATLAELVDEARPELRRMLELHGAVPLSAPAWRTLDAAEACWAGEPPATGLLLLAEVDTVHVDEHLWDSLVSPEPPAPPGRLELKAERVAAVERLTARGLSAAEIARELGTSARGVVRDRAELGLRGTRRNAVV